MAHRFGGVEGKNPLAQVKLVGFFLADGVDAQLVTEIRVQAALACFLKVGNYVRALRCSVFHEVDASVEVAVAVDVWLREGEVIVELVRLHAFTCVVVVFGVKGSTKLGRAMTAAGVRKSYTGSFQIWNPSGYGCQNIDTLEEGARAAAKVFEKYGFRAYAGSRLD